MCLGGGVASTLITPPPGFLSWGGGGTCVWGGGVASTLITPPPPPDFEVGGRGGGGDVNQLMRYTKQCGISDYILSIPSI